MGIRDSFLGLIHKRLSQSEQQPIAVADEDVEEELAKFVVLAADCSIAIRNLKFAHHLWRMS